MRTPILARWSIALGALLPATLVAQPAADDRILEIECRVTDGERKLQDCEVLIYEGNEVVGRHVTDKSGRFSVGLGLGKEFAMVFLKEGFLSKRILVDTRAKIPAEVIGIAPLDMAMSMLPATKYQGADTDDLDFPFAIVRWNKQAMAFVQDQQYTADMMRTNGAALLQAGRVGKQ